MARDPTTLQTAADTILAVLEEAALDAGWQPARVCVTAGEPSWDCDAIHVWPDQITPVRDGAGPTCHIVSRVQFRFGLAVCTSAQRQEDCRYWETASPEVHDKIWPVWIGLVEAVIAGLCGATCTQTVLGPFQQVSSEGGINVWIGTVEVDLIPEDLLS